MALLAHIIALLARPYYRYLTASRSVQHVFGFHLLYKAESLCVCVCVIYAFRNYQSHPNQTWRGAPSCPQASLRLPRSQIYWPRGVPPY